MARQWKPHPHPPSHWPDHVKTIYRYGCDRIDELRKQLDDDGIVTLPFRCYGCDRERDDFGMTTGDGVPICKDCLEGPRMDHLIGGPP